MLIKMSNKTGLNTANYSHSLRNGFFLIIIFEGVYSFMLGSVTSVQIACVILEMSEIKNCTVLACSIINYSTSCHHDQIDSTCELYITSLTDKPLTDKCLKTLGSLFHMRPESNLMHEFIMVMGCISFILTLFFTQSISRQIH